ncbi:MAG: DUF362 domain-containing protein [Desulfatibacillum sp.]|nr:DUF362 domain-containing protein [Desulfatibacillum sp.]
MAQNETNMVNSDIGEIPVDRFGAALGVSRVSAERSYQGISALLKNVIENADQDAWAEIKNKIDYTFENLNKALSSLEKEEEFLGAIKARVEDGRKLLFKPNLVTVENIEPYTHTMLPGACANTEWAFVAAAMRWFHDKGKIRYDQMCLGEAASSSFYKAAQYTLLKKSGRPVTTEAAYEGRSDDFYGGWGFYFVRQYLSEALPSGSDEDPMNGLEDSMAGTFIPPGEAGGRLMVYDLNRISDAPSKGRKVSLPDGENFKSIILHKVIVGGDPSDAEDCRRYPGCFLINMPKLKVHSQAMFTNAIKNLGIGLYPLQANNSGCKKWAYGFPDTDIPTIKSRIPHQVWVPEIDPHTMVPQKDSRGNYKVTKTGGLTGTMLDIIRAVASENVSMMHIVDAIETVNRDHQGVGLGTVHPEGLIVAGADVAAVDLMCARYMFSNVGLKQAREAGLDDGFGGSFPQAVPVPQWNGAVIETVKGYDCVIARDASISRAQAYGMGTATYHVAGWDAVSGNPLGSSNGRLGFLSDNFFTDIHTKTLYWDIYKMPWDLQKTFFGYLDAVDQLEGKTLKQDFLKAFDETGDGSVTYEENGKKGIFGPALFLGGQYISARGEKDEKEVFKHFFSLIANPLRGANPKWSAEGHHFNREFFLGSVAVVAMAMSSMGADIKDTHFPELTWGKGRWPSFSQTQHTYLHQVIYGWRFPKQIGLFSLWGSAFGYADRVLNDSRFVGGVFGAPNAKAPKMYLEALKNNETGPLDFTLYVPVGYGAGGKLPHVKETSDPARVFTAEFDQGKIRWPESVAG